LTLSREQFPASQIIASIENGTFDLAQYRPQEIDRMQMLFWIPQGSVRPRRDLPQRTQGSSGR
jgi:hypothetical protein